MFFLSAAEIAYLKIVSGIQDKLRTDCCSPYTLISHDEQTTYSTGSFTAVLELVAQGYAWI